MSITLTEAERTYLKSQPLACPAMAARHHGGHTVLTGLLDQSALYGVLAEIEALGLDLLAVRQLTLDRKSPGSGDSCSP